MVWAITLSSASLAQVQPNNQQASSRLLTSELLPVPQSPNSKGLENVPPPPGAIPSNQTTNGIAYIPTINQLPKIVEKSSSEKINQLENSVIQSGRNSRVSQIKATTVVNGTKGLEAKEKFPPLVASGGEIFFPDSGMGDKAVYLTTQPASINIRQVNNQATSLAVSPGTQGVQEFAATPITPAALPPLPGQGTVQAVVTVPLTTTPSGQVPVPTFKQLLYSQGTSNGENVSDKGESFNAQGTNYGQQANVGLTPAFNQLLNAQTINNGQNNGQQSNAGVTPMFSQVINSQGNNYGQAGNTGATQTFNQVLNQPVNPAPSYTNTTPATQAPVNQQPVAQNRPATGPALREPSLQLQGVFVTQGDDSAARARLSGIYPLTSQALFGATLDITSEAGGFDDSRRQGVNINELYFATSLGGLPNLRFVVGQVDLTSYFDRNSFAKDGASQFFNSVFQTNAALAATGIASRPSLLVNWSVTDNIDAKAAVFSSADRTSEFTLDGFAGEIGIRYGNAIFRGTYASDRDAGNRDTFPEAFSLARNSDRTVFGPLKDDREEAYGLNAEFFVPNLKLGLFGRYGRYENRDLGQGADTFAVGASFLDLFTPDDRLGIAYGRALSNDSLRRGEQPDVIEAFYDFKFLPNLRLGFTVQGRDSFEETVIGVRVKSELDVTPRGTR
jgi:hypothetical protein